MTDPTGFQEFHKWARENGLSYSLNYSEGEDVWEGVEVRSPSPVEAYYMKRCYDLRYFIEAWNEHMREQGYPQT